MRGDLTAILVGVCIAIGSWAPLRIVEARAPQAMPVGLVRLVIHAAQDLKSPP